MDQIAEGIGMARFHRIDPGLAPLRAHGVGGRAQPLAGQRPLHGNPRHPGNDDQQRQHQQHFHQSESAAGTVAELRI